MHSPTEAVLLTFGALLVVKVMTAYLSLPPTEAVLLTFGVLLVVKVKMALCAVLKEHGVYGRWSSPLVQPQLLLVLTALLLLLHLSLHHSPPNCSRSQQPN